MVMSTPCIRALSELWDMPIPTYFEVKKVGSLFDSCPFIQRLKNPLPIRPIATSQTYPNRLPTESDSEFLFRTVAKIKGYKGIMPHTYVDRPNNNTMQKEGGKKYVAALQGCLAPNKVKKKVVEPETLEYVLKSILDRGHVPVVIGSKSDLNQFWKKLMKKYGDSVLNYAGNLDLRTSASVLGDCDAFISNDTGLYHVAGAYNIPGLVMWKSTDAVKNMSPSKKITHVRRRGKSEDIFKIEIDKFLEGLA